MKLSAPAFVRILICLSFAVLPVARTQQRRNFEQIRDNATLHERNRDLIDWLVSPQFRNSNCKVVFDNERLSRDQLLIYKRSRKIEIDGLDGLITSIRSIRYYFTGIAGTAGRIGPDRSVGTRRLSEFGYPDPESKPGEPVRRQRLFKDICCPENAYARTLGNDATVLLGDRFFKEYGGDLARGRPTLLHEALHVYLNDVNPTQSGRTIEGKQGTDRVIRQVLGIPDPPRGPGGEESHDITEFIRNDCPQQIPNR